MVGAWVHIFIYRLYPIINLCLLECWLEQVKFTKNSETKETELLCQILQVFFSRKLRGNFAWTLGGVTI